MQNKTIHVDVDDSKLTPGYEMLGVFRQTVESQWDMIKDMTPDGADILFIATSDENGYGILVLGCEADAETPAPLLARIRFTTNMTFEECYQECILQMAENLIREHIHASEMRSQLSKMILDGMAEMKDFGEKLVVDPDSHAASNMVN